MQDRPHIATLVVLGSGCIVKYLICTIIPIFTPICGWVLGVVTKEDSRIIDIHCVCKISDGKNWFESTTLS